MSGEWGASSACASTGLHRRIVATCRNSRVKLSHSTRALGRGAAGVTSIAGNAWRPQVAGGGGGVMPKGIPCPHDRMCSEGRGQAQTSELCRLQASPYAPPKHWQRPVE